MFSLFSFRSQKTPCACFEDLPSDFLLGVFLRLDTVADVISLQSVSKRLLEIGRSSAVWTHRLGEEYGLSIKADARCKDSDLQNLYRDTLHLSHSVRYWGVFTDGGCDNDWLQYWVDNLFVPNHWESFCSESGKNVNCVGILVEGLLQRDIMAEEERNFMIHKCRIPASRIFNEPNTNGGIEEAMRKLQGWSRPELVNFIVALYHDMEAGGIWGEYLLHGVPPDEIAAEKARLRDFVQCLEWTSSVECAGILRIKADSDASLKKLPSVDAKPASRSQLFDSTYMNVARDQPECVVTGVIESVTVSRHGKFSCPVASGVLFIGQADMARHTDSSESMMAALQDVCSSESSTAFDDLVTIEMVNRAVEEKRLPPITQRKSCSTGHWVEFSHDTAGSNQLRPIVWFHFYTKNEDPHGDIELAGLLDDGDDEGFEDAESESDSDDSLASDFDSDGEEIVEDLENEIVQDVLEDLPMMGDEIDGLDDGPPLPSDKNILVMPLKSRVGGNVVLLKLIRPEDLMEEFDDHHLEPNIDINSLLLDGKKIAMPTGVSCHP